MRKFSYVAAAIVLGGTAGVQAGVYMHVPGIGGEQSKPGYPGAMAVQRVTVTPPGVWSFDKAIDSASPALFLAVAQGTPIGVSSLLVYNPPDAGAPDGTVGIAPSLLSSYQALSATEERIGLNSSTPMSIYLSVPGILGEDPTPGYPAAMQIDAFTLDAGGFFEITKGVDSATPQVTLAGLQGTVFPSVSVLFYNGAAPGAQPDAILTFGGVLVSGQQVGGGAGPGVETAMFSFSTVPEPAALAMMGLAIAAATSRPRRRQEKKVSGTFRPARALPSVPGAACLSLLHHEKIGS